MFDRSSESPVQDDQPVRFSDEAITSEVAHLLVRVAAKVGAASAADVRREAEREPQ